MKNYKKEKIKNKDVYMVSDRIDDVNYKNYIKEKTGKHVRNKNK